MPTQYLWLFLQCQRKFLIIEIVGIFCAYAYRVYHKNIRLFAYLIGAYNSML